MFLNEAARLSDPQTGFRRARWEELAAVYAEHNELRYRREPHEFGWLWQPTYSDSIADDYELVPRAVRHQGSPLRPTLKPAE